MKQKFFILAAGALALAACSNDENMNMDDNSPVPARVTAGLSSPATRAVGANWNADAIGVMVTDSPVSDMVNLYKNVKYTTSSTGATAEFTAETGKGIFFQDAEETVTFAAYAPYQESEANALPGENGKVTVETDKKNTEGEQEKIDFLFASGATASKGKPTVTFTAASGGSDCSFHHKMAQLNIVFQVSTNDGFSADQILAEGNTFNLGGLIHEGTFDVTTGEATATGNQADSWDITACKHTDASTTRTYSLILLPQDLHSSALKVTVGIDGQNYYNTTAINPNLESGKTYTYTITVKKTGLEVSGCTITNWGSGSTGSGDAEM